MLQAYFRSILEVYLNHDLSINHVWGQYFFFFPEAPLRRTFNKLCCKSYELFPFSSKLHYIVNRHMLRYLYYTCNLRWNSKKNTYNLIIQKKYDIFNSFLPNCRSSFLKFAASDNTFLWQYSCAWNELLERVWVYYIDIEYITLI